MTANTQQRCDFANRIADYVLTRRTPWTAPDEIREAVRTAVTVALTEAWFETRHLGVDIHDDRLPDRGGGETASEPVGSQVLEGRPPATDIPASPTNPTGVDLLGQCHWTGPQSQRCLLWNGHWPMAIGDGTGHLPDRSVPCDKPPSQPDSMNLTARETRS